LYASKALVDVTIYGACAVVWLVYRVTSNQILRFTAAAAAVAKRDAFSNVQVG
jgi:hypothetical protein